MFKQEKMTTMAVPQSLLDRLDKLKKVPREPYCDVVERIMQKEGIK